MSSAVHAGWTPVQHTYRRLLIALRDAYYHDRSQLFWARHRAKVEIYKYCSLDRDSVDARAALGVADEVATFVGTSMRYSVQRIVDHNALVARLPIPEAKKCRQEFLDREREHDSWCKQRIKTMLRRRPRPPFPYT